MATLDEKTYYYFKTRNGSPYQIKASPIRINTEINKSYVEMTDEQREFYIANPSATVHEISTCKLTPKYVPPVQDVKAYAAARVEELRTACYATISVDKVQYSMANAVLAGTELLYTGKKHYSKDEAVSIMKRFMDESDKVSTIYETYKPQIEAASTIAAIDSLYTQAISEL